MARPGLEPRTSRNRASTLTIELPSHIVDLWHLLQTFSWVAYWQGVGSKLSRAVYLAPPPRILERMDNLQILLHHLLQEYLVERDINFISVNLRCFLQMFSRVTYWQGDDEGVGGKLSRTVYLALCPEFQIEWIIQILLHLQLQE